MIGAADIAPKACIIPLKSFDNACAYAVAARSKEKAQAYATEHGIPVVHDSYVDMLNDPNISVIYNPLPNGLHFEWTLAAIRAGKHVLCEKPITNNSQQTREIKKVMAEHPGVIVAEAYHWKLHPMAAHLRDIVQNKVEGWNIGKLQSINSIFTIQAVWLAQGNNNIRYNFELGGGSLMDLGCYNLSVARYVVDAAFGKDSQKAVVDRSDAKKHESEPRVDDGIDGDITFHPSGVTSKFICEFSPDDNSGLVTDSVIIGDLATVKFDSFIVPHEINTFTIERKDGSVETKTFAGNADWEHPTYYYQMKAFLSALDGTLSPAEWHHVGLSDIDDSIANMQLIDDVYLKAGLPVRP